MKDENQDRPDPEVFGAGLLRTYKKEVTRKESEPLHVRF